MLSSSQYHERILSAFPNSQTKEYKVKYKIKPEFEAKLKQLNSYDKIKSFPLSQQLIEESQNPISLKTYTDPFPYINDKPRDYVFDEANMCRNILFEDTFEVSPQKYLNADHDTFMTELSKNPEFVKILEMARNKFKPTIPEEKQWLRFGGSSVWLPQFNCHYMVSRVLFTPTGIANKAFASFLYIQLFDSDWEELPAMTLETPYEEDVLKKALRGDGTFDELIMTKILNFRKQTFPYILPISFDYQFDVRNGKYYYGPEDPRILLRTNPLGFEEPLIVFNMKDLKLIKRVMHLYLPFSNKLQVLRKRTEKYANIEKNWTPFISKTKSINDMQEERGDMKLNFIYSIMPLEVLVCEIDTAVCDFLQKPVKADYDYVGPLRGGTQLVPLPLSDMLPASIREKFALPYNRQIYLGWARAHLNDCGCGESMYRPNMVIVVEDYDSATDKYFYKLGDVSEYIDFQAYVPPWVTPKLDQQGNLIEETPKQCEGRNVLIPNSIAYWDISSVIKDGILYPRKYFQRIPTDEEIADKKAAKVIKQKAGSFKKRANIFGEVTINDFMGVTLSAADSDVSIVHVKGLLNYILKLPSLFEDSSVIDNDSIFQQRGYDLNNKCAMQASDDYCKAYGKQYAGTS
ncbi:Beta-mannosyltransferase 7 [Spathaspora sp. JA1]|nr:Beta-mannosyltransferase 7 [Spathaspora sp. JA1]